MDPTLFAIIAYVLAQLGVAAFVSRRIATEDDYLVAGRSLGYGLSTFTIFATWFGAETCIGAAGSIYIDGLAGGTADPFGYALCILFMGLVFAVPFWKLRLTTLADLFRRRYGIAVERVAVVLMIPTSLLWAAAQIRAFGQVLSAASGFDADLTITIAAGVVIVYTLFGGLLADAWTDLIQGIALIIGLVVLLVVMLNQHGMELFDKIRPESLSFLPETGGTVFDLLEGWAIPVIGSVTAAELISRAIAARSPQVAQRSACGASAMYLAVGLIPVLVGLVGPAILPNLAEPEQVLPQMARHYLPPFLYGVFAGALVSAILSTVDSALLVSASFLSHNIIVPLRSDLTERQKVTIARGAVLTFGIISYAMAFHAEGVYTLIEESSAFGSSGIFTVVVFGLFSKRGGYQSALASLVTGVATWVIGSHVLELRHPYLTSLALAFTAYLLVDVIQRRTARRAASA